MRIVLLLIPAILFAILLTCIQRKTMHQSQSEKPKRAYREKQIEQTQSQAADQKEQAEVPHNSKFSALKAESTSRKVSFTEFKNGVRSQNRNKTDT